MSNSLMERTKESADRHVKRAVRWGMFHSAPRRALRSAAAKGDVQARVTMEAPDLMPEDMEPLIADIRERGPVVTGRFAHLTATHALVKQVLTSNAFRSGFPGETQPVTAKISAWSRRAKMHPVEEPSLLVTEDPEHSRYRKLVTGVFTARAVAKLRERTEVIAAQLLDDCELKSTAGLVLAAGFETTVNLLGNAIRLLCEHPEQSAMLREQPEVRGNCVDEVLRFDPPVMITARTAVEEVELGGRAIRPKQMVALLLAGANRDPAVFTDPEKFDVARPNARDHLLFSACRHFCLGAALARMEGQVGLSALFDRFDVELRPGARRRPTRILRGYEVLPVRLSLRV